MTNITAPVINNWYKIMTFQKHSDLQTGQDYKMIQLWHNDFNPSHLSEQKDEYRERKFSQFFYKIVTGI